MNIDGKLVPGTGAEFSTIYIWNDYVRWEKER